MLFQETQTKINFDCLRHQRDRSRKESNVGRGAAKLCIEWGEDALKSSLPEAYGFLNGLVTVQTEMSNWLRTETCQSNAT